MKNLPGSSPDKEMRAASSGSPVHVLQPLAAERTSADILGLHAKLPR